MATATNKMTTEGWYLYSVNASKSFNDAKVDWGMDGASTHVYRYIYELNFGASGMPITQGTSLTNNNWLQIDTYTDPMLLPFKAYWVLVTSTDTTAPVITLIGNATVYHKQNTTYTDAGASATDDVNGVVTVTNDSDSQVNTSAEGNYTVTYTASDEAGNTATATRTVIVDGTAPVITLIGDATVYVNIANPTYNELNATADTGETVQIAGDIVDINTADGVYTVTYNCTDASGNVATEVTRTVIVDKTRPVISLNGDATVNVDHNGTYTELSATSDGGETVTIGGPIVNTSVADANYTVTYNCTDVAGNAATEVTRTVNIGPATQSSALKFVVSTSTDSVANNSSPYTYSVNLVGDATLSGYKLKSLQLRFDNVYWAYGEWITGFNVGVAPPSQDTYALNSSISMEGGAGTTPIDVSNTLNNGNRVECGNCNFEVFRYGSNYLDDGSFQNFETTPQQIMPHVNLQVILNDGTSDITFRGASVGAGEQLLGVENI